MQARVAWPRLAAAASAVSQWERVPPIVAVALVGDCRQFLTSLVWLCASSFSRASPESVCHDTQRSARDTPVSLLDTHVASWRNRNPCTPLSLPLCVCASATSADRLVVRTRHVLRGTLNSHARARMASIGLHRERRGRNVNLNLERPRRLRPGRIRAAR